MRFLLLHLGIFLVIGAAVALVAAAHAVYRRIIERWRRNKKLTRLRKGLGMMTADDSFARAVELYDGQRFAEAADFAWQCLRVLPDEGRLWQLYGTCRCNLKDYAAAREALEQASALVPLHPLARIALARSYAHLGQEELARTIYEYLVEGGSCPTGLLPAVAVDLNRLGEYRLALKACETLTERDPSHHQAHFGTAYYLARVGASPEALIPPLAMAMDLAPEILHYRLNLAFVLADAGRAEEAHGLLTAVALEEVRCPCWLLRIKDICKQVGDYGRAVTCTGLLGTGNPSARREQAGPERGNLVEGP